MTTAAVGLFRLLALVYSCIYIASATDMCRTPRVRCVNVCAGVASGNYHSCTGCNVYVTCVGNTIYRNRPCPINQIWDDNEKRCDSVSATCIPCQGANVTSVPTQDAACTQKGGVCVDICKDNSACQKGVLYAGLCAGSATRRCCVPKAAGNGSTASPAPNTTAKPVTSSTKKPVVSGKAAGLTNNCINCIGRVSGGAKKIGKCGSVCGPFALTWAYWADCGKPQSYRSCTTRMACSRRCVRAYLAKYSNGVRNSCEYYARVHRGGPYGWNSWSTNAFWSKVNKCCKRKRRGC